MSKVFYNKPAIPIPEGAYKDISDGRVLFRIADKDGNFKRRTIGALSTPTTMYPNELFQQKFPALWHKYYRDEGFKEYELSIGLYALTLGVSHQTSLYQVLHDIYGESNVNYILDYVMFNMLDRSNTTQLYPERMRKEVLFSEKLYSDSWYSDFFQTGMSENQNHQFRTQWLYHCKSVGITEAWLCIDGSNNDCEVAQSSFCEQGNAKSHSHSDIVGYMYVISATDGRPITYYVYEGSKPDHQAFHQISLFLAKAGIRIKGVIVDAGFCADEVIQTLEECEYEYVIMMHNNHRGHTEMIQEYGEKIKWEPEYVVSDDGVFGMVGKKQLFGTHPREGFVNLFFDGVRGTMQSIELSRKIRQEKYRIDKLLAEGRSAKSKEERYVEIIEKDGTRFAQYKFQNWRKDAHEKGFFSILSSSDFGAENTLSIYRLRDFSETAYSLIKSQEGFHTTRVHTSTRILNKFAIAFVTSIIRTEIELACKHLTFDTNLMIRRLEHVHLFLAPGNEYMFSRSLRADLASLLRQFGVLDQHLEALASEVNFRMDTSYSNRYRGIPQIKQNKAANKNAPSVERTEGPGKSSEEASTDAARSNMEKKRVGRKKGTKDSYPRKRRTKAEIERDRKVYNGETEG
mgnify:CR=1 FL=1